GIPESIAGVRNQIRDVAAALGAPRNGEALVADLDARLAVHEPVPAARPKAVLLGPNGFATSYSPLLDEIFARAGLESLAAELGSPDAAGIPIETVLAAEIDVLVVE